MPLVHRPHINGNNGKNPELLCTESEYANPFNLIELYHPTSHLNKFLLSENKSIKPKHKDMTVNDSNKASKKDKVDNKELIRSKVRKEGPRWTDQWQRLNETKVIIPKITLDKLIKVYSIGREETQQTERVTNHNGSSKSKREDTGTNLSEYVYVIPPPPPWPPHGPPVGNSEKSPIANSI